tara:strand:+ start:413 stop:721 length:309 start_codon:yes stop_codon:yes gene_type:complete
MAFEDILMPLEKELKRIGILENRCVNFESDDVLYRNLSNSPSKLESIFQIVNNTKNCFDDPARTVILTDFIRKEFLNIEVSDSKTLNKLGVIPIFKYLLLFT